MSRDGRNYDDWDDLTPDEEARFFGPSRFSRVGCAVAVVIVVAVAIALCLAVIALQHDIGDWLKDLNDNYS